MSRTVSVIVAAAIAVAAFGFGVAVSTMLGTPTAETDVPLWQYGLAAVMFLMSLGLQVATIVLIRPLRRYYAAQVWRGLSRTQRRYASRQLHGKLPVYPHEVEILCMFAQLRRGQRFAALQPGGLALLGGGLAIPFSNYWVSFVTAVVVFILALISLALMSKDIDRMVKFLNQYGGAGSFA